MLNLDYLKNILMISISCSVITAAFIQKTKHYCPSSKFVVLYSFVVNMIIGFLFSMTFTDIEKINSLWIGLFSFIGADTIYRTLERKLASYSDLVSNNNSDGNDENNEIIKENQNTVETEIIEEIKYE